MSSQNSAIQMSNPIRKRTKRMNRQVSEEDLQMAKKPMKRGWAQGEGWGRGGEASPQPHWLCWLSRGLAHAGAHPDTVPLQDHAQRVLGGSSSGQCLGHTPSASASTKDSVQWVPPCRALLHKVDTLYAFLNSILNFCSDTSDEPFTCWNTNAHKERKSWFAWLPAYANIKCLPFNHCLLLLKTTKMVTRRMQLESRANKMWCEFFGLNNQCEWHGWEGTNVPRFHGLGEPRTYPLFTTDSNDNLIILGPSFTVRFK